MSSVFSLDLATRKTGYCVGDGESLPVAGAWLFEDCGARYGELGGALWFNLDSMMLRFPDIELVVVEAPILNPQRDKLDTVRKLFGVSFVVETWVEVRNRRREIDGLPPILVREAGLRVIKRELAGFAGAEKDDMVAAARKLGIALPLTKAAGMEDAADAVGGWLLGLRALKPTLSQTWDRRLWGTRNALI